MEARRFVQRADIQARGERAFREILDSSAEPNDLVEVDPLEASDALANLMDELFEMVDAAHACYSGEDAPSLEQCSNNTLEER